ncbi:TolC family protein [Roseibacillus persicicus]|uniref:TolC family protein n=1 Tax=Roseibacillus persicicus TaxID=454148 RepID=UPI00280DCE9E|nr:TolC family protein [Roseibacillus persicicus]MDQ8190236.1 TolC family protein [Roseibacillus persicicus]
MQFKHFLPLATALLFASCSSNRPTQSSKATDTYRPAIQNISLSSAPLLKGAITRENAIRHALGYSPILQSQRAELRALQAETVQAGLPPNPELGIEIENFAGSGGSRGFDGAEITAALSQRLEVAGKRSKRTLVAALETEAAKAEIASSERDVTVATDRAFTTLLEAQAVTGLSISNVSRAEENLATINALLEAGKSTSIDVGRAKLAVSEAKELLTEARLAESNAAVELSRNWGGGGTDLTPQGSLTSYEGTILPQVDEAISRHPLTRAASLRFALAEATYDLESAKRFSDIEIGGGIRQLRDADETAAVVGVSIPLPLFNRNQGNIQAAKERLDRSRAEARGKESELRSRFTMLTSDLRTAHTRVAQFNSQTVNVARQALADTNLAYSSGKASLLEVLDARKTLLQVERGQVRAQADLLRANNSLKTLSQPNK